MVIAYIALGSNLGKRQAALRAAVSRLASLPESRLLRVATFRETLPVASPPGAGKFINSAIAIETRLSPSNLMAALLKIERDLGRLRESDALNVPRTIDLDLLLYGDEVIAGRELTIPHPRMHERRFVLEPLAEIAPGVVHPLLKRTMRELLAALDASVRESA